MSKERLIPVADIGLVSGVNYRDVNKRHLQQMIAMDEPEEWPPIHVIERGGQFGLVHGRHRTLAAQALNLETIKAIIRDDLQTAEDINAEIVYDNIRHGLPASVEERKAEAIEIHREDPDLSYREIGRRVGLNHITVKRAIEGESGTGYSNQSDDYVKPFARTLLKAYEKESAFFGGKSGERSTQKRAKLLAEAFSNLPNGKEVLIAGRDMCAAAAKLLETPKK
jgi:hypothetical protein